MKFSLKFLFVLQIISGIILIFLPLYALPSIRIITEEPPDISMIIEALQGASPTPNQAQRAAKILTMQRSSLSTISSSTETASRGLEYFGVFIIFSGIVLLIDYVLIRRNKNKESGSS